MWFVYALATTLLWGAADLFYKKGADERDKYSHLKTAMCVGVVMGLHACYTLCFGNINYDFRNIIIYMPVSLMYILSMVLGYFGLRYLELSISSPVQNSSGAIVCILCLVFLGQAIDLISGIGVVLICAGVIMLGVFEKKQQNSGEKKYKIGFIAFMFPIFYAIIDSLGTFFDAYYLDDAAKTPLINVTEETFEEVANTSYELTFLICAIAILIFLIIKKEKIEIPKQGPRLGAAIFETAGQFTYVFAMSGSGVVAAPMVASYSIVSVILSRIFLKEKLNWKQYFVIAGVMIGIILLGVAEGLAE
jgi:drug/metabolite transporter (DMT)-like permease